MYRHQWQAYQQKQIIAKMAGKMPVDQTMEKEEKMKERIILTMVVAAAVARAIMTEDDAVDTE
jgi:uncharacterized membrane protein YebE (DUF533 family)